MPPHLRVAVDRFDGVCQSTLDWLGATEALWLTAPPATVVRMNLRVPQLEALYEAAFLRIFTAWEVTLEDMTIRMMARASTPNWPAVPATGSVLYRTLGDARAALYGNRDYLLWHNPTQVVKRVAKHLDSCPLETVVTSELQWLEHIGNVRHRIAHSSDDAVSKFEASALALTGAAHRGSPGRLLRSQDMSDALNLVRWILRFQTKMRELVADMAT